MENALEQYKDPGPLSVHDMKVQINTIQHMLNEVMKPNVHYGKIPGCGDKPTLLKAGAEKISLTFRLAPSYTVTEKELERGHREYRVSCVLTHIPSGQVFGEGLGVCSTMEGKYRFRNASRVCPACGGEFIIKGKAEYGGGWLCFAKKGGCGQKFENGDSTIESQQVGTIENENPADNYNTALKMAKKRSHVDAVLTATAASDCFTQDIEDMPEVIPGAKGFKESPEVVDDSEADWEREEARMHAEQESKDQEEMDYENRPFPGSDSPKISKKDGNMLYAKAINLPHWGKAEVAQFFKNNGFESAYTVTEDKFEEIKNKLIALGKKK